MAETKSRLGIYSLAAGLLSAGLLVIVAVAALQMPGYAQLPAALVIGAAVTMLGSVLSGLAAVILGVIGLFRGPKKMAVAGAVIGGASVAFLVTLVVIGQRVGGPPLPSSPALRPGISGK